jgi:orc1/cdc6 family replication initiation protein
MITDARVLQPEFIPREVKHRDTKVSYLSDTLRPIMGEGQPEASFLYGPSGAGKTCIAQFTVEQLRENVIDLDYQYVNCWEDHSRYKTLYRLLEGVSHTVDIHRQSTPTDVLLERLREYDGVHYVAILDEVDQLQDKSVLYDLYRIPNLTMILIANREEDVFSYLDERLNSRLQSCARIHFANYSLSELVSILADRARWGLAPEALSEEEMELIADHAAGDARAAISILRNAARMATQREHETISPEIIREAVPEANSEIRQKTTEKLTAHQQALYDILSEKGQIGGGELYEAYCSRVDDPKTQRTMRNHLAKLEQYNLIAVSGQTKGRTYRPRT